MAVILVADDNEAEAQAIADALESSENECIVVKSGQDALRTLKESDVDLVVTDLKMQDVDGLTVLREAKLLNPLVEVILVSGYGRAPVVVEAIRQGAFNFVEKPVDLNELRAIVGKALEHRDTFLQNIELRRTLDRKYGLQSIVGSSPKMLRLIETIRVVAPTDVALLITGETGTGKELVARAIHHNSRRHNRPFVAINCGALSESIIESELFGHEKGSFTGAVTARKGRFEYANGGTLLLDEVGDMPLTTQVKLLRAIDQREIVRVGSNDPRKVDVRILAATNRNLEKLIEEGRFREDLYYRLRVVTISLPPLRERKEDIPILAAAFVKEASELYGKKITGLSPAVLKLFDSYSWPGNVRELRNCIESMVVVSRDDILDRDDLPEYLAPVQPSEGVRGMLSGITLQEAEKELIKNTLREVKGNRQEAARLLGIGERTLYRKITEYDLRDLP